MHLLKSTKIFFLTSFAAILLLASTASKAQMQWIRINQLGYTPSGSKAAVWVTKGVEQIDSFYVIQADNGRTVFAGEAGKNFGAYGPFQNSYRLNFSKFTREGTYFLKAGYAESPEFKIDKNIYNGTADFCLKYMRQQRCGFNPFLQDSCHTHDGYTMYGPMKDSTRIDVTGGWHDASDYLKYVTTTANATWHLLAAYRDYPKVFSDTKKANGLDGSNGLADVLDEARWGLQWLSKMHPRPDWMFNQVADDRDHQGMRIPREDTFYGRGYERPAYFINGLPQQRGKFMNHTTGTSSSAAKMSSAFALGSYLFKKSAPRFARKMRKKSLTALKYAQQIPGVTQTVSVASPYIYAEDNWTDDMELAFATLKKYVKGKGFEDSAFYYATQQPVTPWMFTDTANHYQYYPFVNPGHYELAEQLKDNRRDSLIAYYQKGIEDVWKRAEENAFYRGVPFIWCSNNLTAAFATQCQWYAQLSGNKQYQELMQANVDWLFGCNPWGTSMVYGLPADGDTPVDPHSAFTHLKNYPIDGGLVDGPVYTQIFKNLIGISLREADEYAAFQSDLVVYHDDYGDYSTNEPTMDGTASLIYLLAGLQAENQ